MKIKLIEDMIEMVDNKDIIRATVLVAVITVITYLYYFMDLPGSWALYEFPFILLALWAGMAFSMRVRIPIWLRIVLACICIGMLFGTRYILLAGGRYNNASEVIRAALRRLEEDEARLTALSSAIYEGDSSENVVGFDEETFIEEMRANNPR